ncbi:MAG: restriction endonuclease subunit S [Methanolobus sp.]|uniref:restriction endonuclease subunit S n=1 Tax=Methanolobus sp. TaxID=1874737 RepID=UPI00272F0B7D|nr:restriction endonuclease subunit S [Methanolobus sp.]MDP2215805.1 restriction endonuclease subunit S [Methanolobus sp.]
MHAVIIKDIATVQMGYSFRSRLEASENGKVVVIQMKDLLDDNSVDCSRLMKIDMHTLKEQHFARKGDLVFRSRGQVNTSAIIRGNPGKAVIAAPLLRIRITNFENVLPEYLNWYISQADAQRYLTSVQAGTSVNMIRSKELEEMPVHLPSLKMQNNIVELAALSARERMILSALAEKRGRYISVLLMQLAKEDKKC